MTAAASLARVPRGSAVVLTIVACLSITHLAAGQPPTSFKHSSLVAALQRLQLAGLRVVYSTDLVRPDMIVAEEPEARTPADVLRELLAPHGLAVQMGPAGTLLVVKAPAAAQPPTPGSIQGVVRTDAGLPLAAVTISVPAAGVSVRSDAHGRFTATPIPAGRYRVEWSTPGYLPHRLTVAVREGTAATLDVQLRAARVYEEHIRVFGGESSPQDPLPEVRRTLGGSDIARSPELASDPLLAVARLPGIAGTGGLNVRGGAGREAKIVLDGLELYEPFHLKDRGAPFSLIDGRAIGDVGVLSGAFPAEYGGHLSAIVEMATLAPSEKLESEVAVGSIDNRVANQGAIGERVRWIASMRRGNASEYLEAAAADPAYRPKYWDGFAKAVYLVDARTTVALHYLGGDDEVEGSGPDEMITTVRDPGRFRSQYTNNYAWLTVERALSETLFSRTVVSNAHVTTSRFGSSARAVVRDGRATSVVGVKQDWLKQTRSHVVKWGADVKHLRAQYDYTLIGTRSTVAIQRAPSGAEIGVYAADRLRILPGLSAEIGLRVDAQTYGPDRTARPAPRVNAVYRLDRGTELRAGWGLFYQAQRIQELQVEDGIDTFLGPERAEHRQISLSRAFARDLRAHLTAYQQLSRDVNPRHENLFDPLGMFPEAESDRVRIAPQAARAHGVELAVDGRAGRAVRWSTSYSLAAASDLVDGKWVPRSWDQRHAWTAGLQWQPTPQWDIVLAGGARSGLPTTPVTAAVRRLDDGSSAIVPVFGARNSERLSPRARLDVRLSRSLVIRGSKLRGTVTLIDALNTRSDVGAASFELLPQPDGTVQVRRGAREVLPRFLTFGLSWTF